MAKIEKSCKVCNKSFLVEKKEVNRGNGKYCSLRCNGKGRTLFLKPKSPNVECGTCGEKLYRNKSKKKASKSGFFFCDRECRHKAQRLNGIREIHPAHYGDGLKNYRAICFRNHKKECVVCGETNIVAAHHYDHDHSNNDPANLVPLCPTHHQYVHSSFSDLVKEKIDLYVSSFLPLQEPM